MLATRVHVVHQSHCPDIGVICLVRDEPPHLHDQVLYVAEMRGVLEYGLSESWALELQLPVKLVDARIVYRRLDGTAFVPDYENIHHADETLAGVADPWISVRWGRSFGDTAFSARGGVSVPLGSTEPDPFELGERGAKHQHVQFGTGTFNPILAVDVARGFGPLDVRGYAQMQLIFYENEYGYRAGNRYGLGALAGVEVLEWLRLSAGVDLINEQPERWNGEIRQDGNLGRTDVLAGISTTIVAGGTELTLGVKIPVYQHLITGSEEPGQLSYPGLLNVAIGGTLWR